MYQQNDGDYGKGLGIAYVGLGYNNDDLRALIQHEAGGHGFAKLDDEYVQFYEQIPDDRVASRKADAQYGWWKNVDFVSDPELVKWASFLHDNRYNSESLGVYEGASTYMTGAWRPSEESMMNHNSGGFNAPSRYAIWYRINKLAFGDTWDGSYEDFVSYDLASRSKSAKSVRKRNEQGEEQTRPLSAPPVVIRDYQFNKK